MQYTSQENTRLLQSKNKSAVLEKFSGFVKTTENEDEALVHKMMGEKFQVGKIKLSVTIEKFLVILNCYL